MKAKVFSLPSVERLLIILGYQFDGENYVMSDEMLGGLLDASPYLDICKRLLEARERGGDHYERELVVVRNQRLLLRKKKKEAEEAERLLALARNDQRERKYMKPSTSKKGSFLVGNEGGAKSWKDVGVDICKTGS